MTTVDERTDAYFDSLSAALSARLKEAKGDTTYSDLEEVIGKRPSTMSGHLQPGANLTLRTIAQYEVGLGETVYTVPLDAPKTTGRRRRQRPEGGWTAENESRDADPVETRLYRVLTRLSRRIIQLIQSREDWNQERLAEKAGMQSSHLSRLIGGSVNPTLKTIAALEAALGMHLLEVDGRERPEVESPYEASFPDRLRQSRDAGCGHNRADVVNLTFQTTGAFEEALGESVTRAEKQAHRVPSSPYEKNSQFVQFTPSSDGGFCQDPAGVVTGAMDHYAGREDQIESVEDFPVAA
jgi:transcriptional regulator with XRE-family HTH domain